MLNSQSSLLFLLHAQFDEPVKKSGEGISGSLARLGQQAGGRHSGNGVGFKNIQFSAPENQVGSAVPPAK